MKENKIFIFIFGALLVLYVIAQLNQPKKFDWAATLRNNDKNPFGTIVPYEVLKQIFPSASVQNLRVPAYNALHDKAEINSAYILIEPEFNPGKADIEELLQYAKEGNTVFISSFDIDESFLDSIGLHIKSYGGLLEKDTTWVSMVNPVLNSNEKYSFKRTTGYGYFDSVKRVDFSRILGINQDSLPNFVSVRYGEGTFLIHTAPLCFSNYFMLYANNRDYIAKAFSYIAKDIETIHWDEYYKSGREGSDSPLRFFLSNTFLSWALWLTIAALLTYVFFEMKRRQRIIPVIEPLRNTTLDFVETVSSVYYSQHDNNAIAQKKSQYWYEHIRKQYYLSTQNTDNAFVQQLSRKSGVPEELIKTILSNTKRASAQPKVTDDLLMNLAASIDEFYSISKT